MGKVLSLEEGRNRRFIRECKRIGKLLQEIHPGIKRPLDLVPYYTSPPTVPSRPPLPPLEPVDLSNDDGNSSHPLIRPYMPRLPIGTSNDDE